MSDDPVLAALGRIDANVERIETTVGRFEANVGRIDANLTRIEADVGRIDANLTRIEADVGRQDSHQADSCKAEHRYLPALERAVVGRWLIRPDG